MLAHFEAQLRRLTDVCHGHYGVRLISLAVFGSVGRGTPRPDSDIDVLIVAAELPDGRVPRVDDFRHVEQAMQDSLAAARAGGVHTTLSPVFKTPDELEHGSPLLLDMIDDARILYDREDVLARRLARLRTRLERLGAKRIWMGNAWLWDLKPDYRPGEVFEL